MSESTSRSGKSSSNSPEKECVDNQHQASNSGGSRGVGGGRGFFFKKNLSPFRSLSKKQNSSTAEDHLTADRRPSSAALAPDSKAENALTNGNVTSPSADEVERNKLPEEAEVKRSGISDGTRMEPEKNNSAVVERDKIERRRREKAALANSGQISGCYDNVVNELDKKLMAPPTPNTTATTEKEKEAAEAAAPEQPRPPQPSTPKTADKKHHPGSDKNKKSSEKRVAIPGK